MSFHPWADISGTCCLGRYSSIGR